MSGIVIAGLIIAAIAAAGGAVALFDRFQRTASRRREVDRREEQLWGSRNSNTGEVAKGFVERAEDHMRQGPPLHGRGR